MFKNRPLFFVVCAAVLLAVVFGFLLGQPEPATVNSINQQAALSDKQLSTNNSASSKRKGSADGDIERPFWEDAVIPDPGEDTPPVVVTIPRPQQPIIQRDYEAEVRALEKEGAARQLNDSLTLWFDRDPTAATEWINQTERFEDILPSLNSLALGIANQGQLDTALSWAEAIPDQDARRETLIRIYAHEARQGRVTAESLQKAGFSPQDIATIFSGAFSD